MSGIRLILLLTLKVVIIDAVQTQTQKKNRPNGCETGPRNVDIEITETVPFFGQIQNPYRPCIAHVCIPSNRNEARWVERFTFDRCCIYETIQIPVGQSRILDQVLEDPCLQVELSCNIPDDDPRDPPKLLAEHKQSRCCHFNGSIIPAESEILIPKKCSVAKCIQQQDNSGLEVSMELIFDSCDCCTYQGYLVQNGHWIQDARSEKSITCISGKMYKVEEVSDNGLNTVLEITSTNPEDNLDYSINRTTIVHIEGDVVNVNGGNNCDICFERRPNHVELLASFNVMLKLLEDLAINQTIFVIEDHDENEKSFFRFLTSIYPITTSNIGSLVRYSMGHGTEGWYSYYKWQEQCKQDGCQLAKATYESPINVKGVEIGSRIRIFKPRLSTIPRISVIGSNLKHLISNARIKDCGTLSKDGLRRILFILTVDNENIISDMMPTLVKNFEMLNSNKDSEQFFFLIVILDSNGETKIDPPKPVLKMSGIEVYSLRFGFDGVFFDCFSSCRCADTKSLEEKSISVFTEFKPVFVQAAQVEDKCFFSLHKYVGDEIEVTEERCQSSDQIKSTVATVLQPKPFPKDIIKLQ